MKLMIRTILCFGLFLTMSCKHLVTLDSYNEKAVIDSHLQIDPYKTINSDLTPAGLNESDYYKEMALGYAQDKNCEKADDLAKISLGYEKNQKSSLQSSNQLNYAIATCFYKKQQYAFALEYVQRIPLDKETDFSKMLLTADIYEKAQSYDQAILIYDQLYVLSKDLKYKWKTFDMNFQNEKFDSALKNIDELKSAHEDEFKIHFSTYQVYWKLQSWELALKALLAAEKMRPHDYNLLVLISQIQKKMSLWSDLYETANSFNSRYSFNYEITDNAILASIRLKNFEDAHLLWTQTLQERPYLTFAESDFYPELQIYLAKKDWDAAKDSEALQRLKDTYEARPDSQDVIVLYSKYLAWTNKIDEALFILEKAILRNPNHTELKITLAYVHFKKGNTERFLTLFDEVKDYSPESSEIYSYMAEIWFVQSKPIVETEKIVLKSIALRSQNRNLKPILGQIKIQQNDLNAAMLIFESLYNQNPKELKYSSYLFEIYSKLELNQKKNDLEVKTLRRPASEAPQ